MPRVFGRNLVRMTIVLLAAWGAALIGADMMGGDRGNVPRAPSLAPEDVPAGQWEGVQNHGSSDAVQTEQFWPALVEIFSGLSDHYRSGSIGEDVRWTALARIGVGEETRVSVIGGRTSCRQRVEAALASADPRGRLVCFRDGWRVTITTRDDLDAASAMRAERAAAPRAIRELLSAPVTYADLNGMSLVEILRHVARVYGVRIDADWGRLPELRPESSGAKFYQADVGDLLEQLLRRCGGTGLPPRYRAVDGGIRIFVPGVTP